VTGYQCTDTEDVVDHPRQCPCPGYKAVKCEPIKPHTSAAHDVWQAHPVFPNTVFITCFQRQGRRLVRMRASWNEMCRGESPQGGLAMPSALVAW